jgi:hypothetical protein
MPRGTYPVERLAVEIVREEELAKGCDFFSTPPSGGEPHPVEVKGLAHSLLGITNLHYLRVEVNADQEARARRDPTWRLEIVANLKAVLNGSGKPERLTVRAADVVARATPSKFWVRLGGFEDQIGHAAIPASLRTGVAVSGPTLTP